MSAAATIYSPGRVLVADGVVYVREARGGRRRGRADRLRVRRPGRGGRPVPADRGPGAAGRPRHRRRRRDRAVVLRARDALRVPGHRRGRRDRPHHQRPARRGRRRAHRHAHARSTPSFDQLLGDTFDADSKSSVHRQDRGARARHDEGPHHARDRRQPDRPAQEGAGRHRAARGRRHRRRGAPRHRAPRHPRRHRGGRTSRPPAKGFDYEDLVDECVGTLAAGYGDLAEVHRQRSRARARRRSATRSSPSTATTPTASRRASRSR